MGSRGTIIRLKMPSDIWRYNGICHQACMSRLWGITLYYLVLGKHAALKENRFSGFCFRGRQTWIRLRHVNANGKRRVRCMITSRYLGSPPAPLRTRPLSSRGVLKTCLILSTGRLATTPEMDADLPEEPGSNGLCLECQDGLPEGHVLHVYKCNAERQAKKRGKAPTCCAITRYTSGKGHLPLDQSAMQPKGIMVTIRTGGEELLTLVFLVNTLDIITIKEYNIIYLSCKASIKENSYGTTSDCSPQRQGDPRWSAWQRDPLRHPRRPHGPGTPVDGAYLCRTPRRYLR